MSQTLDKQIGSEEALVTAFFRAWQDEAVPFVVLRNYDTLPHSVGNDLDILVRPDDMKRAERRLVAVANAQGYELHNRAEFSPVALYLYHKKSRQQLHIDLFDSLKWRGLTLLSPEAVLGHRLDKGLFFVPHPVHEATLNLLTRLLYHGYVKEVYKPGIREAFANELTLARATLAETFGTALAQRLVDEVLAEDWAAVEAQGGALRKMLVRRQAARAPLGTAAALFSDAKRLVTRAARPPGLVVAFMGPDGSGKSSVTEEVTRGLERTFSRDKGRYIHWKPSVLRPQRSQGPVTDPHGKPARSVPLSLAYFAFHLTDFVVGSRVQLRPVTFRNGLVIVDRYYYDFFVDRKRYRLRLPEPLISLGYGLVTRPDLVIYLDAPPEVLQARKQEVSFEESARQREAFSELAKRLPNAHKVDASRALKEVTGEVERIILAFMAQRTARRVKTST